MSRPQHRFIARPARRPGLRGLSLVEVMISLAICASLLVAVGAAYNASAKVISANDDFYRASQAARITMLQLQQGIRTCTSSMVDEDATYNGLDSTVTSNILRFTRPGALQRRYVYHSDTKKLRLYNTDTVVVGTPSYSMASNVSALTFTAEMAKNPNNGFMRPVRITIDMTVIVGNDQVRLTGSAVPRYTLSY
jgi:Tfp pilus assembly protein FimT